MAKHNYPERRRTLEERAAEIARRGAARKAAGRWVRIPYGKPTRPPPPVPNFSVSIWDMTAGRPLGSRSVYAPRPRFAIRVALADLLERNGFPPRTLHIGGPFPGGEYHCFLPTGKYRATVTSIAVQPPPSDEPVDRGGSP